MSEINPYRYPAGTELDRLIQRQIMGLGDEDCPPYSTDERAARQVLTKLKSSSGKSIVVGKTALRQTRWFARYETDASDGTEVLAESLALAICRLALLRAVKGNNGTVICGS